MVRVGSVSLEVRLAALSRHIGRSVDLHEARKGCGVGTRRMRPNIHARHPCLAPFGRFACNPAFLPGCHALIRWVTAAPNPTDGLALFDMYNKTSIEP